MMALEPHLVMGVGVRGHRERQPVSLECRHDFHSFPRRVEPTFMRPTLADAKRASTNQILRLCFEHVVVEPQLHQRMGDRDGLDVGLRREGN